MVFVRVDFCQSMIIIKLNTTDVHCTFCYEYIFLFGTLRDTHFTLGKKNKNIAAKVSFDDENKL